ncbi:hypothetical protein BVRB_3g064700 [Beta vulgaris subsp. vulgaris]|nr:hypothetical protein BVRB_3g064700 [Beta vulgaris subsp. vulgaris]
MKLHRKNDTSYFQVSIKPTNNFNLVVRPIFSPQPSFSVQY